MLLQLQLKTQVNTLYQLYHQLYFLKLTVLVFTLFYAYYKQFESKGCKLSHCSHTPLQFQQYKVNKVIIYVYNIFIRTILKNYGFKKSRLQMLLCIAKHQISNPQKVAILPIFQYIVVCSPCSSMTFPIRLLKDFN